MQVATDLVHTYCYKAQNKYNVYYALKSPGSYSGTIMQAV